MRRPRDAALLIFLLPALSACSLVRGSPDPGPSPRWEEPGEPIPPGRTGGTAGRFGGSVGSEAAARITSGVVETAMGAIGTPYLWGGTGENGFDCSGLIQYAYGEFGILLPRISTDQLRTGMRVDPTLSSLSPGDILGFSGEPGGKETTHVGLYVGEGEFIHSGSRGVTVSKLDTTYWIQVFMEARRIVW